MTVRAAGGVVWRRQPSGDLEVLLVHRPAYGDWSLPKGKAVGDETDEMTAVREVEEETGLRCELGPALPSVSYRDRHGQDKVVRFWAMRALSGSFEGTHEVDEIRWLPAREAPALLTYERDRVVLDALGSALGPPLGSSRERADEPRRRRPGRTHPGVLAAVAAGGALGAPARYELTLLIHVATNGFPWNTFWINVSGSFALGLILILVMERFPPTRYVRPFLATGFLGAFTTFSTFAVEADLLVKSDHVLTAMAYAAASLAAGLAAVWAGTLVARIIPIEERIRHAGGTPAR